MPLNDFYPWNPGQVIRPDDLNELVRIIQDGTIFENTSYITEQLSTNGSRITGLEERVSVLEGMQGLASIREQLVMTNGQSVISLAHVPSMDSEMLFINGICLAKSGIPASLSGDYSISGSTVTLVSELASQIVAGDRLIAVYRYEV